MSEADLANLQRNLKVMSESYASLYKDYGIVQKKSSLWKTGFFISTAALVISCSGIMTLLMLK
jgi:hypothetical protein